MLFRNSKLVFIVAVAFLIVAIVLATWGLPKIVKKQIQKKVSKEKYDPNGFRDALVQALERAGGDLDAAYKFLDASDSKLDYRCYGEVIFDVLIAGGCCSPAGRCRWMNIQIENSSMMYEKWLKTPMPLDFKVYIFNVTNTDEVNIGEKPKLVEIGPYVYKQYREREVLGYGDNDTIIYNVKKTFVFDPEASNGFSEDDDITVINFSYMGAVLTVQDMMPTALGFVNKAFEEFFPNLIDPFSRVKVKDLLFDGIFLNCVGNNSALGLVCGKIKMESRPTMRVAEEDGVNGFYFSIFGHVSTLPHPATLVQDAFDLINAFGNRFHNDE